MTLIDLAAAKSMLGITDTTHDSLLATYVAAVQPVVEGLIGPIDAATETATFNGGGEILMLTPPVASVTSVTANGAAVNFVFDPLACAVYGGTTLSPLPFQPGEQNVTVTYAVGGAAIPGNVTLAALELIRVWWQTTQQGTRRGAPMEADTVNLLYAVPQGVVELLRPNLLPPNV